MKSFIILALSFGLGISNSLPTKPEGVQTPNYALSVNPVEAVAEKIFDAYSTRNLDNFVAYFSVDVEVALFPNKILYKGKDELRKNYADFFKNTPHLKCELLSRKVQDNRVIEEMNIERIKGKVQKVTILYEIANGVVQKMVFL